MPQTTAQPCCTSTCTWYTRSPRPQAFDGLRMTGRTVRRPDLTVATEDHNVPTENQHLPIADEIWPQAGRHAAVEHRRVRHHELPDGTHEPGHRPRHRPRTGAHAAGHDHRVRRQPHQHPRRIRRDRVRHRHQRGRARARHPDAASAAARNAWRSPSTASCPTGAPPRTSCSRSSARSARAAASVHRRVPRLSRSRACRWKAA